MKKNRTEKKGSSSSKRRRTITRTRRTRKIFCLFVWFLNVLVNY